MKEISVRKIILLIVRLLHWPKRCYKVCMFKKNAVFPSGMKTVTFSEHANCFNTTGDKSRISIGHHCDILSCISAMGPNARITIGDYTTLRGGVVGSVESIAIGSYVISSNHVNIYDNNNHPTDPEIRVRMCESGFYSDMWKWEHSEHKPIVIEDNVWIGEYSTILKGVTIGKGAIVASHSVVTKDVEPYTIVAGNPAKIVKRLQHGFNK